jgi:hypothetical protein
MRLVHLLPPLIVAGVLMLLGGCHLIRFGSSATEDAWDRAAADTTIDEKDVEDIAAARAQDLDTPPFLMRVGMKAATGNWMGVATEVLTGLGLLYGTHQYTKYAVHRERDAGRMEAGEEPTVLPAAKLKVGRRQRAAASDGPGNPMSGRHAT